MWLNKPPLSLQFRYCHMLYPISMEGLSKVVNSTVNNIYEYQLLNIKVDNIINNNKWNYDFKNHVEGQCKFVHEIDEFNYSSGDSRYFYELGRLHFLPTALAYAIVKSDRNLICQLKEILVDWYRQNSFLKTLAWKSGNEVGIRVINLIYFRILFDVIDHKDDAFDSFLAQVIELHYQFIVSHLSLYSSKGNHHVGEMAGVIAICSVYSFKNSEIILQKYVQEMESEIIRLIYPDGFNKEQSTNYQTSYINLAVTALILAKMKGKKVSADCWGRICHAYEYIDLLRIKRNEFFHIGDTDNAELLYPYADRSYNIYESQLNDAVVLFGKERKDKSYFDLRNYLLFGDKGLEAFNAIKQDNTRNAAYVLLKESGNFIARDENINLLFDFGKIGLLPSMSHGHADMLNVLLYIKGIPVLVDCGCYQYNIHFKKFRDYFHGTSAHNTISINKKNQATLGSGMFWMDCPEVKLRECAINDGNVYISAFHDGYKNSSGITHRRDIEYHKQDNKIVIIDFLTGGSNALFSFFFHFYPGLDVRRSGDELMVEGVKLSNKLFCSGELVVGDENLPMGWYSPRYDARVPTTTFVVNGKLKGDTKLETIITY